MKQREKTEDSLRKLIPSLIAEPIAEVNLSCRPPIDFTSFGLDETKKLCSEPGQNIFTGEVNSQAIKIGVVIMLGFESDVVEIRLREMYDFVDKIFIGESTNSHRLISRKPLIWDYLSRQERFKSFLPKISRFIVDESNGLGETWQDPLTIYGHLKVSVMAF